MRNRFFPVVILQKISSDMIKRHEEVLLSLYLQLQIWLDTNLVAAKLKNTKVETVCKHAVNKTVNKRR